MRNIKYIVVHCTAGAPGQKASDLKEFFLRPVARGGRGWKAPGYHYVVERDGTVAGIWSEERIANGVKGYNTISLHIAYTGGVRDGKPADTRTPAQRKALGELLARLHNRYPKARVCGHRDLSPDRDGNGVITPGEWIKACPCFDVAADYGYR